MTITKSAEDVSVVLMVQKVK